MHLASEIRKRESSIRKVKLVDIWFEEKKLCIFSDWWIEQTCWLVAELFLCATQDDIRCLLCGQSFGTFYFAHYNYLFSMCLSLSLCVSIILNNRNKSYADNQTVGCQLAIGLPTRCLACTIIMPTEHEIWGLIFKAIMSNEREREREGETNARRGIWFDLIWFDSWAHTQISPTSSFKWWIPIGWARR